MVALVMISLISDLKDTRAKNVGVGVAEDVLIRSTVLRQLISKCLQNVAFEFCVRLLVEVLVTSTITATNTTCT